MNILKKIDKKMLSRFGWAFSSFMFLGMGMLFAQEHGAEAGTNIEIVKWLALSSGIGLGLAAMGCGLGQGKMVSSAMDGIARNPQAGKDLFVPMILGLAFIESLSIYALIFVFIFKAALLG